MTIGPNILTLDAAAFAAWLAERRALRARMIPSKKRKKKAATK